MANTALRRVTDRSDFMGDLERGLHHGNAPMAIALADLDDFATINERFGHDAGDAVLAAWERVLSANAPQGSTVYRLGGDEYSILLPGVSAENAVVLMEEMRGHYASKSVPGVAVALSASVGVAANPPHGSAAEDLWRAAGEALMRAKRDGRDRVALFVEEKMVLKSNYYSKANLERLSKLSGATDRTEASLLREALDDLLYKYRDDM
ncbi:MAG TPA: GGDEF domain-containing protein [Acidimicrobiales bacterium]|nr:GGDEF domain-containing protein [Acidimicrobiales bacterium]